ncbi:hypothetical protein EUGRSUZ_J01750 [Eucalyptus grandis]|uniref:Uncharacterized protein n=2 Tax=Eucalyptus grandis TaxID=71139 RepID=A0ACC3J5Z9_EUCGR|nr:hypothetical protein EUGRSUZ_J01750 [Eucalyptus grandis]
MSATLTKREISLPKENFIYFVCACACVCVWTPHASNESLGNFCNQPHEQTKQALLFVEELACFNYII